MGVLMNFNAESACSHYLPLMQSASAQDVIAQYASLLACFSSVITLCLDARVFLSLYINCVPPRCAIGYMECFHYVAMFPISSAHPSHTRTLQLYHVQCNYTLLLCYSSYYLHLAPGQCPSRDVSVAEGVLCSEVERRAQAGFVEGEHH